MPIGYFSRRGNTVPYRMIRGLNRLLGMLGLTLGKMRKTSPEAREGGETWPGYADTMVGMKRLDNLEYCVRTVITENVPGDLIETGVWRGGSCILMRGILKAMDVSDRRVFLADSFQGLPLPEPDKYPSDAGDVHYAYAFLAVAEETVRHNFERYGLLDDQVVFLKGFFADTLPTAPIEKLAVLRLDGDMYSSTMDALENLYHKLSPGGFCIIDDYALPACAKAVEDFRNTNDISEPLEIIDNISKFWRKRKN
jgi:O-methyltransferase